MPNKILVVTGGTVVRFAPPEYGEDVGAATDVISIAGLVGPNARQSDKADMDAGAVANRFPHIFAVTPRIDYANGDPPSAGESIDFYWAASVSSVAATANPGGVTGSDSAYSGTAGSTLDESLKELQFLGSLITTADDDAPIQQTTFLVTLPTQFGTLVVVNNSSADLAADGTNLSITFTPREYEVQ